MTKQVKIAIAIIVALAIATVALYFLNRPSVTAQDSSFNIEANNEIYEIDIALLEEIGIIDIAANYNTSNTDGDETRNFEGVPLVHILEHLKIDMTNCTGVVFTANDSYSTGISIDEALDPEICFIATGEDGEQLQGRENGGSGPFMMVLPNDQFSQRWCKYLAEVTFNE